ncbi:MAG: amino acid synthesis family protein [Deinococcus-Thermus bacterium]|nr:amino acid synthesis family protein [Deinococcota bacterium]
MSARKIVFVEETATGELGETAARPVTRVAGIAIFTNPLAGAYHTDLEPLFALARRFGEELAPAAVRRLEGPPVSYGKAAIVGSHGEFEHGGAILHPTLGAPMRAACGGGEALIPSNVKVAAPGTAIDVPLGHKDEAWSFDHFDSWTLTVGDAPRPNELVLICAFADGGRVHARSGDAPRP